jgi:membrane fusion protein, multidrug efflux system
MTKQFLRRNLIRILVASAAGTLAAAGACAEAPAVRGVIRSLAEATISVEYAARVLKMPVLEGEAFKKGEVLIAFDCKMFNAEIGAARANLRAQELVLTNNRKLLKRGAIGSNEVDISQAQFEKARAELLAISARTNGCDFKAPFSGRMVERIVQEHESPSASQPLIRIVDTTRLELETIVPSLWLGWLKPGVQFEFKIDETGQSINATVVRLGATVDAVSQTVKAISVLDGDKESILPGMSGTATFSSTGS